MTQTDMDEALRAATDWLADSDDCTSQGNPGSTGEQVVAVHLRVALKALSAAREEIARKDAVIETYKQGIDELLHPIIVERNAEILALRAQLSTPEPSAVTVTDGLAEREANTWTTAAQIIEAQEGMSGWKRRIAALFRDKAIAALQPPHRTTGEGE